MSRMFGENDPTPMTESDSLTEWRWDACTLTKEKKKILRSMDATL